MPHKLLVLNDPTARYLRHLVELPDSVDVIAGTTAEPFREHCADATAVFAGMGTGPLLRELWPALRRVRWVHSFAVGVDGLLFPELVASPVTLTNSRGIFARSLAEFAIASMLHFAKDLPRLMRNKAAANWEPYDVEELHGKTVCIVGYGEIGRAVAVRANAFGMRVIAVRRRVGDDDIASRVVAPQDLPGAIAESDYIVAAAPLTSETEGLIGAEAFTAMRPNAVLINIGRGPVVDEAALVAALTERRIRGAGLDVFTREPLDATHPLWTLDNVLLSPHSADHTDTWLDDAMKFFTGNFLRFYAGGNLQNQVDKQAGY